MMDDAAELARFASALMRIRDRSISECDRLAAGQIVGPSGQRWRSVLSDRTAGEAVHELIPDIVDHVLYDVLDAIDNDELPLSWRAADGSVEPLSEVGQREMAGWLRGPDSWRERFSSQRFSDPVADALNEQDHEPSSA